MQGSPQVPGRREAPQQGPGLAAGVTRDPGRLAVIAQPCQERPGLQHRGDLLQLGAGILNH